MNIIPKPQLPNTTAVLVLGICSIVFSCFYAGLIVGIIGLVLGNKSKKLYAQSPDEWEGYGTLNAGYIMSIIGTAISGVYTLISIVYLIIVGSTLATIFGAAAVS